ncbi:MAG TPA: hypothetical protein VJA21_01315 [Verrucomicrobiae bacterium]
MIAKTVIPRSNSTADRQEQTRLWPEGNGAGHQPSSATGPTDLGNAIARETLRRQENLD